MSDSEQRTETGRRGFGWWLLVWTVGVVAVVVPGEVIGQGGGAAAYIVVDRDSRKILSGFNIDEKRQVASLTKVATAVVVLDWAELSGTDLGVVATVPPSAMAVGGASPLGLRPGDRIALRDALYAALMGSDNVAAETLAHHVGVDLLRRSRKRYAPVEYFVAQMNALAEKLGMERTRFTNPHGMDHQRPVPYSTAADMARLMIAAKERSAFRFYVQQLKRKVSYQRYGQPYEFVVTNTNKLVAAVTIDGIKTGSTRLAGPCLALSATRDPIVRALPNGEKQAIPRRLVAVLLGAPDRFGYGQRLLDDGFARFDAWNAAGRRIVDGSELLSGGDGR